MDPFSVRRKTETASGCQHSYLWHNQVKEQPKLCCPWNFFSSNDKFEPSFHCCLLHPSGHTRSELAGLFHLIASTGFYWLWDHKQWSPVKFQGKWVVPATKFLTRCWHENIFRSVLTFWTVSEKCQRSSPSWSQGCWSVNKNEKRRQWLTDTHLDLVRFVTPRAVVGSVADSNPCWSSPCGTMKSTGSHAQHPCLVTTGWTSVH